MVSQLHNLTVILGQIGKRDKKGLLCAKCIDGGESHSQSCSVNKPSASFFPRKFKINFIIWGIHEDRRFVLGKFPVRLHDDYFEGCP